VRHDDVTLEQFRGRQVQDLRGRRRRLLEQAIGEELRETAVVVRLDPLDDADGV
jgi:hypothetical protein